MTMLWYWVAVAVVLGVCVALAKLGVVAFPRMAHWTGIAIAALVLLAGGFMAFDGIRALATGSYVTPQHGPRAGELGPWSKAVLLVGIDPRSTLMKLIFVVYGVLYLVVAGAYLSGVPWARWALPVTALLGMWYLPFGTIIGVLVIILVLLAPGAPPPPGP